MEGARLEEMAHQPNEYCLLSNLMGDALVMALMMLSERAATGGRRPQPALWQPVVDDDDPALAQEVHVLQKGEKLPGPLGGDYDVDR